MSLILAFFLIIFIPGISFCQDGTADGKAIDRAKISKINENLRDNVEDLSQLETALVTLYTSMTAHQAMERHFIERSTENIANIKGIYRYVEDALGELLLIDPSKVSYYNHLKNYEIEKMRTLANVSFQNIQALHPKISNEHAVHVIDQATQIVRSGSELLAKAMDILEQHRG